MLPTSAPDCFLSDDSFRRHDHDLENRRHASDLVALAPSCPTRPQGSILVNGRRRSSSFPRRSGGGGADFRLTTFPPVTAAGRRSEPSSNVLERIGSGSSVLTCPTRVRFLIFIVGRWSSGVFPRRGSGGCSGSARRLAAGHCGLIGTRTVYQPGWNASDLVALILSFPTRPRFFVSASGRRSSDLCPWRGGGGGARLPCTTTHRSPRPWGAFDLHLTGRNASDLVALSLSCLTRPRFFVLVTGRRSSDLFPRRGGSGGYPCDYPQTSAALVQLQPPPTELFGITSGSPERQLLDATRIGRFGHRSAEFIHLPWRFRVSASGC